MTSLKAIFNFSGAVFLEVWKRQNSRLAAEWHVRNYENYEPDLPDFVRRKEQAREFARKDGKAGNFFFQHSKFFKYSISFMIVVLMVNVASYH